MDVENLAKELILKNMTPEQQMAVLDSVRQSVANAKEVQKKKIGENVDLVVQALKKIESDIRDRFDAVGNSIEKRVLSIQDGRDGADGKDGRDGKDGKSGRDGLKGDRGVDGQAGRDGVDGVDGISVVNAQIDFDGSLVITLSDGRELNVGEVVSQDIAEKIKVISTMSTNGAVGIKDEGTSISTGVKTINFVGAAVTATNSGDDVTVNVSAGTGTVTSVGVSGGTTGLTTTGSPITTTGTITLGGTLAVASGGTGTATPSLVAGTNITSITGTWPNQTINASGGSGTVTSVAATVPAFLSITGSPVTTTGTLAISLSGTALPVTNGGTGQTSYTDGQLLIGNTTGNTLTKTTLTAGSGISITNGSGSISIAATGSGTVTSVTGTSPVVSSGGTTPDISLAANYGDTLNPYASKTAKFVLAAPNAASGVPTFRALVASDIPTLNQSTTGSAATLTTARAIYGNNFDGSAALTQIIASTYGGTGNGFTKFSGATTAERTYTLPDANSTIVVQGGALGTPSSGTLTNCTFPTLNQNTSGSAASLSATLVATSGGTGQSSYAVGDLLYASTTTALSKLADVATGNALISGGVSVAPSWGKIALTTHVSGTLPVANGGTGLTSIAHTVQIFTSSSGTYTTPANVKAIWVRCVGGGGGGGASATNAGSAGGNTTFGSLTASGGSGGGNWSAGGSGGSASGGDINIQGGGGASGGTGTTSGSIGGQGGNSAFGGGGAGSQPNSSGSAGATNSGGGGSGGNNSYPSGAAGASSIGAGGGAGGYTEKLINSPSATYSYAVGASGAGGTAGSYAGGAGSAGVIIVTEYYV